ncbi:PrpF family protein [Bradyrhizobium sp. U87765 SZCCT0131]|uniref:2-methylaconitate cis-trans isomerase PrpF family protein n=1 Tax=unclassified Bradyrhizobium TaxID=2631580 RepID=UPI001BAA2116|nr:MULTISPECIES: PrpF domain-containing protein [unclassified Bradyrhizobium]MBR1216552.1 PrpF family protein [Bradyrhizobium sp. U87765 SZCCT0131]MBR1259692.1 PrpF family protein [Bradyrhizobium sp. U87765 SZCCT0134]MBR1305833.1 PrpF family protein [Bradyrhizobium sp. U87765 SZCCT0110]MBR1322200.1 PrpF family protein [Bradyrhizobium sp. U87765 SZCCT0109]MBR1350521.1 PrpF family protein [Bradyrhizobium sp. U87765 SZCCT0048]
MPLKSIPAVFMRGGTSKGLMFRAGDLPDRDQWDRIFTAAMGSPDPNGRQLDGLGGGLSSLSKVCVLGPPTRDDADIDYTFAQVLIREDRVDYAGNCGNMSSAVGPFAIDEGLVRATGDAATVRIHNTNTGKIIHASFPLSDGASRSDGDLAIPGVAGTGAPIRLDFLDPGGATTGRLLPSGHAVDRLIVPSIGPIDVSLVDAANAAVFVRAADIGLTGRELPDIIERDHRAMTLLGDIRAHASVAMGIAGDVAAARQISSVPFIGFVAPASDFVTLAGDTVGADDIDLHVRMISSGQPHRALPLTAALCAAVAARVSGTLVADALSPRTTPGALRLGMPSGVLTVDADVTPTAGGWHARSGAFYRTARRLFDGRVWVPVEAVSPASDAGAPHRG